MPELPEPQPKLVTYKDARRAVWGDPTTTYLSDWFYVRNERVCVNLFGIPPNTLAGHSPDLKAIFGADEVHYLLQGEMMAANPQTGEVHQVLPGEAIFFRKDTWHHCFNASDEPLVALEFFHPSPELGTGSAYARQKPDLEEIKYGRDDLVGHWPMEIGNARSEATMWVLREQDYLWRIEGDRSPLKIGLMCSTEHATIGKMYFLPGQRTDDFSRPGDQVLYVENGSLHVELPDTKEWFELGPMDSFYVPGGRGHRFYNPTQTTVTAVFVVAPDYLTPSSATV